MKKILYNSILTLGLGFLLMTSCTDEFLELTDPNSIISDNFYKNEDQVEQAVNGVYGQLQNIVTNQYIFTELVTDNTTVQINPQDRGQADRVESIDFWTYEPSNFNLDQAYKQIYNSIHNINSILQRMEGADLPEGRRNQFTGEMLFLRAYHYFHLTQYFGDVVLLTEPIESVNDSYERTRTPSAEVYSQIITDLQEAANLLPLKSDYTSTEVGRAPKGAALALLGKVYLTIGQSAQAIDPLREVTGLGYDLLPDYASVFDPANKNHAESIFEVQYQGGNNLGENSVFAYIFAPINSNGVITGYATEATNGWNMPTNSIIDAFEPGDVRKDVSLQESYVDVDDSVVEVPYINKYINEHSVPGRTDDNWPVIRYSEVLLLLAEAINEETGGSQEAIDLVNQVRARAGLAGLSGLDQTALREAIFQERRVELAFENHRWFDLKRLYSNQELLALLNAHGQEELQNPTIDRSGVPYRGNDYDIQEYELLFPIPETQMILHTSFSQNPGY